MTSVPVRYTELQAQRSIAVEELYRSALRLAAVRLTREVGEGQARRELERAARDFAAIDRSIEQRTAPGEDAPAAPACCHPAWIIVDSPLSDSQRRRCTRCGVQR